MFFHLCIINKISDHQRKIKPDIFIKLALVTKRLFLSRNSFFIYMTIKINSATELWRYWVTNINLPITTVFDLLLFPATSKASVQFDRSAQLLAGNICLCQRCIERPALCSDYIQVIGHTTAEQHSCLHNGQLQRIHLF